MLSVHLVGVLEPSALFMYVIFPPFWLNRPIYGHVELFTVLDDPST